jgi:putative acetyltransferase
LTVLIREEELHDIDQVRVLHASAFGDHGHVVVSLVDALRQSLTSEAGLSLVACAGDAVVGHVFFSRNLLDTPRRLVDVQVLSPLAVLPGYLRRGIGTSLAERGVATLEERSVPAILLEGSPTYYSRVGFVPASDHGFRKPSLRIPDAGFHVRLLAAYEPWMTGTLVYRQTFWDHDLVGIRES